MRHAFFAILLFTLAAGCTPAASENPPAEAADAQAKVFDTMDYRIRVVTVAGGLSQPYSLAFLPDGSMLVTEIDGRLRVIRNGVLAPDLFLACPRSRRAAEAA